MEEQNQEKETVTQHVTVTDAAAPDTGKGQESRQRTDAETDAAAEKAVGVPVDGVAVFG